MEFKTILVFVDGSKQAPEVMKVAFGLARRSKGHVIGMHVRPRFQPPAFTDGTYVMDTLYQAHDRTVKAEEAKAAATFKNAGRTRAVEWRVVDGFADDELAHAARYADLVVIGQADPDMPSPGVPSDLAEQVALHTERPVLVVPHVGAAKEPGKTVLLAWNGSREASRAATAALPLLAEADKVVVLSVDGRNAKAGDGHDHDGDVAQWLSRHGVKATVQHDVAGDTDIGSVILSRAADHDADLIVMGVYGHSRMREMVLGGVSRTLLQSMTAPLLIAH
jgi:nucleotide-binding universal stress UspA family protein